MKNSATRERRDWTLLIFLIPIGILLMLIAGQIAIRLSPFWSITADMRSRLDPNSAPKRQMGIVQPIGAGILTPYEVNLTPDSGGGVVIVFPPIVIFKPNGTAPIFNSPVPTVTPIPPATATPLPTQVRPTLTATKVPTSIYTPYYPTATTKPTNTPVNTATRTPTGTATITLTPTRTPTPTITLTFTRTPTITSTFTQTHTSTPIFTPTETPTITPTFTQTFTPTETPTITPTPTVVTDPRPPEIGTSPDGTVYDLFAGSTLTLNINTVVGGNPGPDLIYYEFAAGDGILLDWVIIEIGDGQTWYQVFNWGDNNRDMNTNMDFNILAAPLIAPFPPPEEPDQRDILTSNLYNLTGVTIDLDIVGAPPGTYPYLRISAPTGDTDGQLEIDAIQVLP